MKRRDFLKTTAAATGLAAVQGFRPSAALAQGQVTFTIVPANDLAIIDPIWTTALISAIYGDAVYDTLYGYDMNFKPQPQMAEGHVVSDDGLTWTITLRDGLTWHEGGPVTAADCIASIKRWGVRDTMGQTLIEVIDSYEAPDPKTIVINLKKPFPMLNFALAKPAANMAAMMPESVANTDPYEKINTANGSGPFKFKMDEWVSGSRAVFEKFEEYKPREDASSFTAGAKVAHIDRLIWSTIPDASTAISALLSGEVDALEQVASDYLPMLRENPDVQLVSRSIWSFLVLRFNHLQPPFDNVEIRRVIQSVVDQKAYMTGVFGEENKDIWLDLAGFFTPDTPMASDAGMEAITGDHDLEKAAQALKDAGYDGTPVVLMDPADSDTSHAAALLTADLLQRIGMNVDLQTTDWGTVVQRRAIKGPPSEGGWNIFFTSLNGPNNMDPAGHLGLRGNGEGAWFGWPENPEIEELRLQWFFAEDQAEQQEICRKIQISAFDQVPFVNLGAYTSVSAYSNKWTDIVPVMPIYFNMNPTA